MNSSVHEDDDSNNVLHDILYEEESDDEEMSNLPVDSPEPARIITKEVLKISYNPENESIYESVTVPVLASSHLIPDDTVLEDADPELEFQMSSILRPNLEPEPEKPKCPEVETETDYDLSPPDFIAKELPGWKMGEDLPDKNRSVVFSKCPKTLYEVKYQLNSSLAFEIPEVETAEINEVFIQEFEEECRKYTDTKSKDPKLTKNTNFAVYVSPEQPEGRIALRDDFQYIWTMYERIRGKGRSKGINTTTQYCNILFGAASYSLYNFVESRGTRLEYLIFPQGMSSSSLLLDWAGSIEHPSSQSKNIFFK